MNNKEVYYEILDENAILPTKSNVGDACYDVFTIEDYSLKPGERHAFRTGLKFRAPKGYFIELRPRSGLALKYGITIVNTPAVIDRNYGREVFVILVNLSNKTYNVKRYDRIAQMTITPSYTIRFIRRAIHGRAGLGSTGR